MVSRLAVLPRFAISIVVCVVGALTATVTFAASQASAPTAPVAARAAADQSPQELVVPDVRKQAYVFAKGTLEDSGFAWKVSGAVRGFAANTVELQSPAPGTKVYDTGAPLVTVTLARNKGYAEAGEFEMQSGYGPTALKPVVAPKPVQPVTPAPVEQARAKKQPAPAQTKRTPAFEVAGAPAEPLDEIPLTQRAKELAAYVEAHPKPNDRAVQHWLYQHAWIVEGAKFGWWRGAEALEELLRVDKRVFELWGIGAKSEAQARRALAEVKARSR